MTATDASCLAAETFLFNGRGACSDKSGPTPNLTWTDGIPAVSTLPAIIFTDAIGLKMTFAGYELGGLNVTSWLPFDPTADFR